MNLGGFAALSAVREVQVPLLAFLLVSGCAAKARRAISSRSVAAGLGPTAMFPLRLRRPVAIFMCSSELGLGAGLIATAERTGAAATVIRAATALLFVTAVGALHELRTHRPEVGCGCFGELSDTPVGLRTISRSALLSAAAVISIGAAPLRMPPTPAAAGLLVLVTTVESVVLGALSPELGELLIRLGYSEPCEVRRIPVAKTLAALRSSSAYRRYRRLLSGIAPGDVWREGCWRFIVYPTTIADRDADIVFAVYLQAHRPPIRVAVIDAKTGEQTILSAPVPADASLPAVTFAQPSRSVPVRRHNGFSRIIQPHTGRHSAAL